MRYKCFFNQERYAQKIKRLTAWHRWFAWFPVETDEGICVWFEFIERKFKTDLLHWRNYRLPRQDSND